MKHDIHKIASWLEKVCREGVVTEQKVLAWKLSEMNKATAEESGKRS